MNSTYQVDLGDNTSTKDTQINHAAQNDQF
jgi:hypothetical protein